MGFFFKHCFLPCLLQAKGSKYAYGYNVDLGDKGYNIKIKSYLNLTQIIILFLLLQIFYSRRSTPTVRKRSIGASKGSITNFICVCILESVNILKLKMKNKELENLP